DPAPAFGERPDFLKGAPDISDRAMAAAGNPPPDMQQGYPNGQRTRELTRRAGWCLGPWKMSEEEALATCLEWNRHNTPPLDDEKVRATASSIARSERAKGADSNTQERPPRGVEQHPGDQAGATDGDRAQGDGDRETTQRDKLISIGLDAELWHDKDGNP